MVGMTQSYGNLRNSLQSFVHKKQSILSALSCRNIAISFIAEVPELIKNVPEHMHVEKIDCIIERIQGTEQKIIETSATVGEKRTKIRTHVQLTNVEIKIISSQEILWF